LLPYKDFNPRRTVPYVTFLLIGVNIFVFLWELKFTPEELSLIFSKLSVVPAKISTAPFSSDSLTAILRSMFFHGGWFHLFGNMLFLYLFGDNVEDRFGHLFYLLLYLFSGYTAVYAQTMVSPDSIIPMVGASGAVSGILGSYLILFPGVQVRGIIPSGFFFFNVQWPAWVFIGFWFLLQVFSGLGVMAAGATDSAGVAFFAHIGGFIVGVLATIILLVLVPQEPPRKRNEIIYDRARNYWW
jgi:membrane associated rhomboid family serine protease